MSKNKLIRKFLLRSLRDKAEIKEIEIRLIEDSSFAIRLLIAEDELIEEFLDDELPLYEKRLFIKNFLISAERLENFRFLGSLIKHVRGKSSY